MERIRTKIAGPAIAAGAVSLGLVLIGACGIGKQDTYVAPPPLQSDPNVVPAAHEGPTVTVPKIAIPPSPTWQIAPYQAPHATPFTGFATTTTGEPTPSEEPHGYPPHEGPSRTSAAPTEETSESPTTRPTRPATTARPRPTTTTPDEPEPTTARQRPSGSPSSDLSNGE